jgi:hypothetical protein
MISEKDICFVTTSIYTKFLAYQSTILRREFPESTHLVINGTKNWPNSWFYWIDEAKKTDCKYFVHIDEDFFLTSKVEFLKIFEKMEAEGTDVIGVSDGYFQFRAANPVAINSFLLIGRIKFLKNLNFSQIQFGYHPQFGWQNNYGLKFKEEYKKDFNFKHEIQAGSNFLFEQEPYYAFLWSLKELGCKFDYLYPYFDDRFKSTNPRITKDSPDIGIHMWFIRNWNNTENIHGLTNQERYRRIEKHLTTNLLKVDNSEKTDVYIHVAVMGNINEVLTTILTRIHESGLYDHSNHIYLSVNGDINQLNVDLSKEKYIIINDNKDVTKCEFPTVELLWRNSIVDGDNTNILYLMTKGVSRDNPNVIDQLNMLNYFLIDKWRDRLSELKENDCTSVNLRGNPEDLNFHPSLWGYGKAPKHYSGNFWWTKSSHVKKLINPVSWCPDNNFFDWRMMCEMWICMDPNSKYHNAYSSTVDHYQSPYPKELYQID